MSTGTPSGHSTSFPSSRTSTRCWLESTNSGCARATRATRSCTHIPSTGRVASEKDNQGLTHASKAEAAATAIGPFTAARRMIARQRSRVRHVVRVVSRGTIVTGIPKRTTTRAARGSTAKFVSTIVPKANAPPMTTMRSTRPGAAPHPVSTRAILVRGPIPTSVVCSGQRKSSTRSSRRAGGTSPAASPSASSRTEARSGRRPHAASPAGDEANSRLCRSQRWGSPDAGWNGPQRSTGDEDGPPPAPLPPAPTTRITSDAQR